MNNFLPQWVLLVSLDLWCEQPRCRKGCMVERNSAASAMYLYENKNSCYRILLRISYISYTNGAWG